jgi:hypothetical protein
MLISEFTYTLWNNVKSNILENIKIYADKNADIIKNKKVILQKENGKKILKPYSM